MGASTRSEITSAGALHHIVADRNVSKLEASGPQGPFGQHAEELQKQKLGAVQTTGRGASK